VRDPKANGLMTQVEAHLVELKGIPVGTEPRRTASATRYIKELLELRESVVAIEMDSEALLLAELFDRGIPVIQGNARLSTTLEQANVADARAVIMTTGDDLTNLDIGLLARDLNARARIVLRLFDETLASKVAGAFAMPAISTSQVAAPAFIAAATGRKVYQGFQLAGQYVHLTDLIITQTCRLAGRTVREVQADNRVNIVMHQGPGGVNANPSGDTVLAPGDTILVIAPMEPLLELEALNQPAHEPFAASPGKTQQPSGR
jgi:Trk K+ transport system NAD-binding subunit